MDQTAVVRVTAILLAALLMGCGESVEDAHERGYEQGYNDGQWDVCKELAGIAPGLKDRLRNCRGY